MFKSSLESKGVAITPPAVPSQWSEPTVKPERLELIPSKG